VIAHTIFKNLVMSEDSQNPAPIFNLKGVNYSYDGRFPALRSIDLTVHPGDQLAIVGTNGSGKSSLLHILDGLIFPTSGEIRAYGQTLSEEKFREASFTSFFRRRVGLLFQNPDVQLFCPTVQEEVAFGPLQLDFTRGEALERTREMVEMLGLEQISLRSPHQLSGGEKKKVAIASMLAVDPDVLLLDEPTGGLDPRMQVWLMELLYQLHSIGKTIIISTHDLSILEEISDRAVVMGEDHSVAAEGPPAEILDDLDLLLKANLIHEHVHRHREVTHSHRHFHFYTHRHEE
jgi:cobalt/nickel transport system ATP-binding protein